MTTYKIYKNMITVFYDGSNEFLHSDADLLLIMQRLSTDFLNFSRTLPIGSSTFYYYVYETLLDFQCVHQNLLVAHPTQFIIDMLHKFLFLVHRYNYPKFRIIFVNEI